MYYHQLDGYCELDGNPDDSFTIKVDGNPDDSFTIKVDS
jgi:hypothetical protein